MDKVIPIFKKENLSYSREEKEGYWTFISKLHPETRELIVNFTGREILELCDGIRSLEEIEAEMVNRYPSVGREQIKNDVCKSIATFSRLGIIEWVNNDNPFLYRYKEPLKDNLWLAIGQEDDIDKIESFVKTSQVLSPARFDNRKFSTTNHHFATEEIMIP